MTPAPNHLTGGGPWHNEISRTQWLVLAGTTLGWGLDGFAGSLYILVLGPAMGELLPTAVCRPAPRRSATTAA